MHWFVLQQPATLSVAQIDAFAAVVPFGQRATQPLNERVVSVRSEPVLLPPSSFGETLEVVKDGLIWVMVNP